MDTLSCSTCHSDPDSLFQYTDMCNVLGSGLEVRIDELAKAATSGCQPCTLLLNTLRVFQGLSPDFKANYHSRDVTRIFVQRSHAGTLKVALASSWTYVDRLEIYTQVDSEPLWPTLGCGKDVLETLTLTTATEKIKGWLAACEQHPSCTVTISEFTALPTRVLLIDNNKVSLVETAGRSGRYATLSHCWGTSQPITTTRDTLDKRYADIGWSSLPHLFQDTIALTRELGIQYLWIDSLCIIQDDNVDWTRESAQMASIYRHAHLNIAATAAAGSGGSLFSKRWTTPLKYAHYPESLPKRPVESYLVPMPTGNATVRARYTLNFAHKHVKMYHHSKEEAESDVPLQGPLLTRSWAFQERILSPRTVHFHASEMIWECNDSFSCECGALDGEDSGIHGGSLVVGKRWMYEMLTEPSDPGDSGYSRLDRWLDGVELYSRLGITKCTDRLPALAGLAASFANRVQSPYLAGLWHCDLPRSLCWRVVIGEGGLGKPCLLYSAPSWYWASVDISGAGPDATFGSYIAFGHLIHKDFAVDERYELKSVECITDPESPFGKVTSGCLKMQAGVLERPLYFHAPLLGFFLAFGEHLLSVWLDFNDDFFSPRESGSSFGDYQDLRELDVLLAAIGTIKKYLDGPKTILALVLRPVVDIPGKYERIGILECEDGGWFLNAEIRTIEII
ncbi:hypothetical protein IFR05_016327 [Cadophora sp. M221]|nr:hypothetical protein IFR05_016327 [Cadophora sp. M221]